MHLRRASVVALAFCGAIGAPAAARAQTLGATALKYPDRILPNGTDIGSGPRPQNLTPLGISYADCVQDQSLKFSIAVSGFAGQDIQIWATKNGMCSNAGDRGSNGVADCWPLPGGLSSVNQVSSATYQFTVRVQDIIGPQSMSPSPIAYSRWGASACATQPTFSSQTFSIWFIPIQNGNSAVGTAYSYQLPVDLLGPPAPGGVGDQVGDTLFTLTWTPNSDTATIGYDVFLDPIPGQEAAGSGTDAAVALPEPTLVCPDSASPAPPSNDAATSDAMADSGDDGAADAASDASTSIGDASRPTDAGCYYVSVGGPTAGSTCGDPILQSGSVVDGGQTFVPDDSGEGGTYENTSGGVSTIPSQYLVGASGAGGLTISDKSVGTYTITGLKNGVTYNAVVSAVDGFGNVGPPSVEQCDYPAPVNDFWTDYRNDGGRAGGGFCALEAVGASPVPSLGGVGLLIGVGAVIRRRRRRSP